MAFSKRTRPVSRHGTAARLWEICRGGILLAARAVLSVAALAGLAAVILYLRLLQGPIVLPGMAEIVADRVNAAGREFRIDIGDVVLRLGRDATTSGLILRDVAVRSTDGQPLLAVPRMGARFRLADLVHGRIQPVRIRLLEPDARIVRTADGRFRLGLGQGAGVALEAAPAETQAAGIEALAQVIDGFVGDRPPVAELAKLDRIEVIGANLVYDDRQSGRSWRTRRADLKLWHYPGGARASLEAVADGADGDGPAVSILADRPARGGRTDLTARFVRLPSGELAAQADELEWLELIGGTVAGEASLTLEHDGAVTALAGSLAVRDGRIVGLGRPIPFTTAELDFRTDPARERITVRRFRLRAAAAEVKLDGYADMQRDATGAMSGLAGQFRIDALHLTAPGVFARPVDFDGGRLTARWSLPEQRIEVADARLSRGDVAFTVDGQARATPGGWVTDLRAEAAGMTVADLVALWPLAAAEKARAWIFRNVPAASIDRLTAQMRLGGARPRLSLDFDYSGLTARYVRDMPPIEEASGSGHLSYHDLFLRLDSGHVAPASGEPIELAGSALTIGSFWGEVTSTKISVAAAGPTAAVFELIDEEPLHLVSRVDRGLRGIGGTARVEATLDFPLIEELGLDDIAVEARATLSDVATAFTLAPGRDLDIRADRLEIAADKRSVRVSSEARIEGAPISVDWHERYGDGPAERTLALSGTAAPGLRRAAGMDGLPVEGAPPFELTLRQTGGGPFGFTLDADLGPAQVAVAALDWTKAQGVPARLHAEGTAGEGTEIRTLTLDSPGLDATGSLRLDDEGRLVQARFDRVRQAGRGSFAATLQPAPDGVMEIGLTGRSLDLSDELARAGGDRGAEPFRLSFDLARLKLGERIVLAPAKGTVEQRAGGDVGGRIEGRLGASAPVAIDLDLPAGRPGSLRLTSPDAGAALRAAGLYDGAEGGKLSVDATIGTGADPTLSGRARIEEVRVHSQSTFREVLRHGGLDAAGQAVSSGGIGFRKVWVPFTYRGGVLTLDDAIAVSPALGLKLNGTVDATTDDIDMIGVLSPAYALTGALNEVPLLGKLLGGEGEGVLAMTFSLRGPAGNPRLTVNPLSMLAPGFLRKIFSRPTTEVSEDFRRSITRKDR